MSATTTEERMCLELAEALGVIGGVMNIDTRWSNLVRRAKYEKSQGDSWRSFRDAENWTDEKMKIVCHASSDASGVIAFRQMKALETIAECLVKLVNPPLAFTEDGGIKPAYRIEDLYQRGDLHD